jgi:hypothetical protein
MPEHHPAEHNEVRSWVLTQVVVRTVATTDASGSRRSKLWRGGWVAVISGVTVALAVQGAPAIAYAVPVGCLALIGFNRVRVEVTGSRTESTEHRLPVSRPSKPR